MRAVIRAIRERSDEATGNVQIFKLSTIPRKCRCFVAFISHRVPIVAKIDDRGMETDLKPHAERGQISLRGPNGSHPIPAVKLFFENLAADLSQKLKSLFFVSHSGSR
jgi:hypothetical protein